MGNEGVDKISNSEDKRDVGQTGSEDLSQLRYRGGEPYLFIQGIACNRKER